MIMSWIFCIFAGISCVCAIITGQGTALAASVPKGAQAGITLALSLGGSLCLWTGVGKNTEYPAHDHVHHPVLYSMNRTIGNDWKNATKNGKLPK